ncbi:MAG: stage III sporulation protein AC [Firmicutes bacterium]|jgi:stage III sporulation protein AC|nr:stage III sporulation protein AC [Clostridia bacterium]MBS5022756.1 stage III sporulation protein AC [Bacillota bacterium]
MDISILFKIAAIGIIVTVICQILKKSDRDDIATVVSIVGLILVLTVVISMVGDLFGQIKQIFDLT